LPLYHLDLYRFLDQSTNKKIVEQNEPNISFLVSQLEEILQTSAVTIIEWAPVLTNQFDLSLHNLCKNGYLSLDLQVDPDNDQSRIVIITATGKKDQRCHLLFSNLCALSKKFLSN